MRSYLFVIICVMTISHVSADGFDVSVPDSRLGSGEETGRAATEPINFEVPSPSELKSDLVRSRLCFFKPAPACPTESRRNGEQGIVLVKTTISSDGTIDATIEQSSNYPTLDAAAIRAVKSWRCHRPVKGGKPISFTAVQPFSFILRGE